MNFEKVFQGIAIVFFGSVAFITLSVALFVALIVYPAVVGGM